MQCDSGDQEASVNIPIHSIGDNFSYLMALLLLLLSHFSRVRLCATP